MSYIHVTEKTILSQINPVHSYRLIIIIIIIINFV
jgi:hypothetical protein